MSAEFKNKLTEFISAKIESSGKSSSVMLTDNTPLISSGLLESLYLLELAVLIEEQLGATLDLTTIDFAKEWDTIDSIVNFTNGFGK